MMSRLLWGKTEHARSTPGTHKFSYSLFYLYLDLSELVELSNASKIFKYNKRGLLSVRDSDYLNSAHGSILHKHQETLSNEKLPPAHRTLLLTMPRFFGYAFNPVNFFICFDRANEFHSLTAEVNNTFGEKHLYVLPARNAQRQDNSLIFSFPKEFYVSPFLEVAGTYQLSLNLEATSLKIAIQLSQNIQKIFYADISGNFQAFSDKQLVLSLIRFPLAISFAMIRIHWQALVLFVRRRASLVRKPTPQNRHTTGKPSSFWHFARLRVLKMFSKVRRLSVFHSVVLLAFNFVLGRGYI